MPYIPLRNGQSVFIEDPQQADQRYKQEWESTTAKPQAAPQAASKPAPKPAPKTTTKTKNKRQSARNFDVGQFLRQQALGAAQGVGQQVFGAAQGAAEDIKKQLKQAVQGAGLTFLAGPFAPVVAAAQSASGLGKTKIPGTQTTIGQESARVLKDAPRQALNSLVAAGEQIGAVTQGVDLGAALASGGDVSAMTETNPDLVEQRFKNAEAAIETLQKTGRDVEGFKYGIKPSTPIVGPIFSDDSEYVKQYVKPQTAVGQFASTVASAMLLDRGISSLSQAPSLGVKASQTALNFQNIWKAENIKQGLELGATFLAKDLLPDALVSAIAIRPEASGVYAAKLDQAQKLETNEQRVARVQALMAESPDAFNYAYEQYKELGMGAVTLTGLRGAFWAANRFFNKAGAGVPLSSALKQAVEEATPETQAEVVADGIAKAYSNIEEKLGEINFDLYRKIDENVGKITFSSRSGAEAYLQSRQSIIPEIESLTKSVQELPDVTAQKADIDARVAQAEQQLGIKTEEQLIKKRADLEARLASYDEAVAKDPNWINKSTGTGKRASKNSTKVRLVNQALERLDAFDVLRLERQTVENLSLEKAARVAQLENALIREKGASIGFRNSLSDARILVDALDQLNAQRIGYLEARNRLLFSENRLDEIDYDYTLKDNLGQAYGELKDLLNSAEIAVATDNLNPEFVDAFIARVDEIHNKVIDNGGLAPVVGDIEEFNQLELPLTTGLVRPKAPTPVVNKAPLTKTDSGEIVIDSDLQAVQRASNEVLRDEPQLTNAEVVKDINKGRNQYQNPAETKETLEEYVKGVEDTINRQNKLIAEDPNNGLDLAKKTTKIFNTNAVKYTADLSEAAAVKASVEFLDARDPNYLKNQYRIAFDNLADTLGGDSYIKRFGLLLESEKFGKEVSNNLNKVIAPTAMLRDSGVNALKSSREYRIISNNPDSTPNDRAVALSNLAKNFALLKQNLGTMDVLFQGFGNGLRSFAKQNQIEFVSTAKSKKELLTHANKKLLGFGDAVDFAEIASKTAREAKEEVDNQLGEFLKKAENNETFAEQELAAIEKLADEVVQTEGNIDRLRELKLSGPAILRGIQTGSMISAPQTIGSIPVQNVGTISARIMGQLTAATLNGTTAKFLGQTQAAAQSFKRAKLETDTLLLLKNYYSLALDQAFKSFVFGRSITDPSQAMKKAFEMPGGTSLRRDDAILADLQANKVTFPFVNYTLERGDVDPKIFDFINNSRVFGKVFHDYFIAGERWQYRSLLSKALLGPSTSLLRRAGLGKTSYYPAGEYVNLSLPFQLSAAGDEMTTALFANARVHAKAIEEVDEKINAGLLNIADREQEITKLLDKEFNKMYSPVTVGLDSQTIGYSILDNQFMELIQASNMTAELTGGFADVAEGINKWRYSSNPVVSAFANDMAGIVTSPLNAIKNVVMISSGGEIVQAGVDVARVGFKNLPDQVLEVLPANMKNSIKSFESKYFSSDFDTRIKAQGALALATGLQLAAFFLVRDGNQDITGGLENSYRPTMGQVDMFTWKVGDRRFPYRYFPPLGDTIALHATLRDLHQFGVSRGNENLVTAATAALANYILDTPGVAGIQRAIEALSAAGRNDTAKVSKVLSGAFARAGDPYLNLRKVIAEGIDPSKPASPTTRFTKKGFYQRKAGKGKFDFADVFEGTIDMAFDTLGNTFGYTAEYQPLKPIIDILVAKAKNLPETSSRKALWYGKPGETVSANHAGQWYMLQSVLGRYWAFPDKLEDDPVKREIVHNLQEGPRTSMFHKDGVGMDETQLNYFNWFLNSELEYTDPVSGKQHKGIHSALKDFISRKDYASLPSVDSPFLMPSGGGVSGLFGGMLGWETPNWDRDNNPRKIKLSNHIKMLFELGRQQYYNGTNEGQRYKMPAEMKEMITNNRLTGGTR